MKGIGYRGPQVIYYLGLKEVNIMRRKETGWTPYHCPDIGREVRIKILAQDIYYRGHYNQVKRHVVSCSYAEERMIPILEDLRRLGLCRLTCKGEFEV